MERKQPQNIRLNDSNYESLYDLYNELNCQIGFSGFANMLIKYGINSRDFKTWVKNKQSLMNINKEV